MIIVMAASGTEETVSSPRHVWCFSDADARRALSALEAQYPQDDMDVFSVDFPELGRTAQGSVGWRKTAEDCTEMALAMYLKSKQPVVLELCSLEPLADEATTVAVPPAAPRCLTPATGRSRNIFCCRRITFG